MLSKPILRGRIGKWTMALSEFAFKYVSQKAVKGQALADFLADHLCLDVKEITDTAEISVISLTPWKMSFDGSRTQTSAGAGIVIESPKGLKTQFLFQLAFECSNNQAEYEALIIGLEILKELGATFVEVIGDSMLALKQLAGEYNCHSLALSDYYMVASQLIQSFDDVILRHVPREQNREANEMAQVASGVCIPAGVTEKVISIRKRCLPSLRERFNTGDVFCIEIEEDDWRYPLIKYLRNPNEKSNRKIRLRAIQYVLFDKELYKKGHDDMLLKCLSTHEAMLVMAEVHEGICGAHQAGTKMRWLIRRYGYFWPTILSDCIKYAKGCEACQRHGPMQHIPAVPLNPIVKPWPFRGWAMDLIGKIYPPSSKQHTFIIVATDYFTKWVEARPMKSVNQADVIRFIKEDIIHRFGIPETITADRGTVFTGESVEAFVKEYGIKLTHSTPYYAQANGQAEATNKVLKAILEKMVDKNPREWHELLSETLWAYRTSKRSGTGTTPFALTYGHDAVLPLEVTVKSLRITRQHNLTPDEYNQAMMQELEELDEARLMALEHLQVQKKAVARAYNKKIRLRNFGEGDLVWKTVLPIGSKDPKYGKWSPSWEGPYVITKVLGKGAYQLQDIDGTKHSNPINGRFLKKYYPTVWEGYKVPERREVDRES